MKKLLIILSVCILSACEMIAVTALNMVETTEFQVEGTTLLMTGEINSKTLDQFEDIYRQNPQIRTLVELDVPGSLDDDTMIALAYRVRELGLNTHLRATSEIYSGGVDLFLAGIQRSIESGAIIGVHSWSDGRRDAYEYPRDAPEHEQNRRYIEDMLGSDEFYWFTIYAAPANGIHVMTEVEIQRFDLETR
ncbi:hypothetical protein AKJ29_06600 [Aliiroseovarius crassostreae]|uniref:Alpha/beta hydrolase n=2 Tax=Aliiroseovarius crassostreae TaxID=154981 RepID=A0A0P7KLL6_9RHOB|nr:hypothetical protein [Aliiroseovarius crassostreae]KPN64890.1 hypothetical protein AKJ29_06600 [Aliiroseovarius crassostreae]